MLCDSIRLCIKRDFGAYVWYNSALDSDTIDLSTKSFKINALKAATFVEKTSSVLISDTKSWKNIAREVKP